MFDTAVIGGGPGGYTAALYCARAGFNVVLFEAIGPGGQMANTTLIENYPGFGGIDGYDLGEKMAANAERFGVKTINEKVTSVELVGDIKKIITSSGTYEAKTVVIAVGADPKKMGLPDEDAMRGHGVAYCATCDGMMYKGKTVAVIGGGNTAVGDALYLSKMCSKVYLIHRRDSLRASKIYLETLKKADNIEIVWNARTTKILHEKNVTGIELEDTVSNSKRNIECSGIFVAIGRDPSTSMFKGIVDMDKNGYIVADETTRTSVPGVFAVGDVRTKPVRQIVTAAGDGATASKYIEDYLAGDE